MQVACEDWTHEEIGAALRECGRRLLSRALLDAVAALIDEHAPDWQDLLDASASDDLLARKWLPPTADDSDKRVRWTAWRLDGAFSSFAQRIKPHSESAPSL
jgi:hypothetical protein